MPDAPRSPRSLELRAHRGAAARRALGAWALGAPAAALASAAICAGLFVAAHHPIHAPLAVAAFVLWVVIAVCAPNCWLFVLPALLPVANFAPWTGWIVFDEFDLVVIGAIAAGHARLALSAFPRRHGAPVEQLPPLTRPTLALVALCASVTAFGLLRGLRLADGPTFDWYAGYADPLNAWRVGKDAVYVLLLLPLLRRDWRASMPDPSRNLLRGMLAGIGFVTLAVIWERAVYPGLLDFSEPYRVVGPFWEMHVGGAAIDAYLTLAAPFVAWMLLRAQTPLRWTAAAAFALCFEYAVLTTYSRGPYVACTLSLAVLGVLIARRGGSAAVPAWRRRGRAALLIAVLAQAVAVVGADTFMFARMKLSPYDFGSRLTHWQDGLRLLAGPAQVWLGRGLGRLPADYSAATPEREFSGRVAIVADASGAMLRLSGPQRTEALAGLYALTQRVPIEPAEYRVALDLRAAQPVSIGLSVCEMHLIYEGACVRGEVHLPGADPAWQRVALPLQGSGLGRPGWLRRPAVFAITVQDAHADVDIRRVVLSAGAPANLLRNADFSQGLAHWLPAAQHYFVPWHIDNLYLELLIEQGIVGLVTFGLLVGTALRRLLTPRSAGLPLAPVLVASLVGALALGLVSSLLDVPRVAFLMVLFSWLAIANDTAPVSSAAA